MITITAVSKEKKNYHREIKVFNSLDKCKKFIYPYVQEMAKAKKENREPVIFIDGVSFDTDDEKSMLLNSGAYIHEKTMEEL